MLFGLMNTLSLSAFLFVPAGHYWLDATAMLFFGLSMGALLCFLGGLMATDIAALVAERAFSALRAPIRRVTAPHTPVPFSDALEDLYIPDAAKIEAAVRQALEGRDAA